MSTKSSVRTRAATYAIAFVVGSVCPWMGRFQVMASPPPAFQNLRAFVSQRKLKAVTLPSHTFNVVPSPDGRWLVANVSTPDGDYRNLWICATGSSRWKYIGRGTGFGTWAPGSKAYAYGSYSSNGHSRVDMLVVPSYRIIRSELPYGFDDLPAFSPNRDEIAMLAGPKGYKNRFPLYTELPPEPLPSNISIGFEYLAILGKRSGHSGADYVPSFFLKDDISVGLVQCGTTPSWSPSGNFVAFVSLNSDGEGTLKLVSLRDRSCLALGAGFPLSENEWFLNDDWILCSTGIAIRANDKHQATADILPSGMAGFGVVNACQCGPNQFRVAVVRYDDSGENGTCEVWQGSDVPSIKLTRRLLSVNVPGIISLADPPKITFTQDGKYVWIPVNNGAQLCAYPL